MYIVPIGWMFVVLVLTVAEATSSNGTVLGAFFTLLLYGLLPLTIVMYVLGTPGRKLARRAAEAAEEAQALAAAAATPPSAGNEPDAGGHAAGARTAAERKEP